MTIRFATLTDIPALVEGGSRMHALTRFRNQPYNAQKVAQAFSDIITQGQGKYTFLVAANAEERIVGALIGLIEQQIFSDSLTASVMHFDVLPDARMGGHGVRLLRAFEQWCANRNVVEISLGVNSGAAFEKVGRFIARVGYSKVGENFVKEMK